MNPVSAGPFLKKESSGVNILDIHSLPEQERVNRKTPAELAAAAKDKNKKPQQIGLSANFGSSRAAATGPPGTMQEHQEAKKQKDSDLMNQ